MSFAHCSNTHHAIIAQSKQHDSFYLYGEHEIATAAETLCDHFPDVTFLYSLKNNPCAPILNTLLSFGFGTDAASLAEVLQSANAGVPKEKIQYSAPGKTNYDIATALPIATLIADSLNEVLRIQQIAMQQGIVAQIGVRVHPDFSFDDSPATPSKFGIQVAHAFTAIPAWNSLSHVKIVGLHIHCRSQSLASEYIQRYHQNVLAFATRFQQALGTPLAFVNLGAGIGIPYAPTDTALDLAEIAATTNREINAFHQVHPNTQVYIETGRYCVGNNGIYAAKVLDIKTCGDETFVILANTLNGFIRPCIANLLERGGMHPIPAEPLYTAADAFDIFAIDCSGQHVTQHTVQNTAPLAAITSAVTPTTCMEMQAHATLPLQTTDGTRPVTLVGNLCTATDVLAKGIVLPPLHCDDMIVVTNAGSYAAVLSPVQFSRQNPPVQLFLAADGTVTACLLN